MLAKDPAPTKLAAIVSLSGDLCEGIRTQSSPPTSIHGNGADSISIVGRDGEGLV